MTYAGLECAYVREGPVVGGSQGLEEALVLLQPGLEEVAGVDDVLAS